MRYAIARHNRAIIDESYRSYVTESLRLIPQMSYLSMRWTDIIHPKPQESAEDIVDGLVERLGEKSCC